MEFVDSSVEINSVIWITSLKEHEKGLSRRIVDDLAPLLKMHGIGFVEFEPTSRKELEGCLDTIAQNARRGLRPIIHIDTHGGKTTGLHIVESNENVPWSVLSEKFTAINVATGNNLCVLSFACYGLEIIRQVSILKKVPYYILAAPADPITAGEIDDMTVEFYRTILETDDLIKGYNTILAPRLKLLHCEQMLFEALARYVRAFTMGAGKQQRVEDLITEAKKGLPRGYPGMIKRMRKAAKEGIKPTKGLLDRYGANFLIGRRPNYDFRKLMEYARKIPDPYADGKRQRPRSTAI